MSNGTLRAGLIFEFDRDEEGRPQNFRIEAEPHEQQLATALLQTALGASAPQVTPSPAVEQAPLLSQVVNGFIDDYRKLNKPAMLKKHEPVLRLLLELVGDRPVSELRQTHIKEFFAIICALPPKWRDQCRRLGLSVRELAAQNGHTGLARKSFEDTYLASVRSFLVAAKSDWQDQGFPTTLSTDGIKYTGGRGDDEEKQRAFYPHELKVLFEGSAMHEFARDPDSAHKYWLPLIGLFTGARVNEICQINPQADILQEQGVWCFLISEETDADERITKSVKTEESRKVPIHHRLIELGLLDYVKHLQRSGSKLLFPQWKPKLGRASPNAEVWFRDHLRALDLRDETPKKRLVGMHAFRHTLLTYGAAQKPQLNLTCISGHAQGKLPIPVTGAAQGYITLDIASPISDRSELLDQLNYPIEIPIQNHGYK